MNRRWLCKVFALKSVQLDLSGRWFEAGVEESSDTTVSGPQMSDRASDPWAQCVRRRASALLGCWLWSWLPGGEGGGGGFLDCWLWGWGLAEAATHAQRCDSVALSPNWVVLTGPFQPARHQTTLSWAKSSRVSGSSPHCGSPYLQNVVRFIFFFRWFIISCLHFSERNTGNWLKKLKCQIFVNGGIRWPWEAAKVRQCHWTLKNNKDQHLEGLRNHLVWGCRPSRLPKGMEQRGYGLQNAHPSWWQTK